MNSASLAVGDAPEDRGWPQSPCDAEMSGVGNAAPIRATSRATSDIGAIRLSARLLRLLGRASSVVLEQSVDKIKRLSLNLQNAEGTQIILQGNGIYVTAAWIFSSAA